MKYHNELSRIELAKARLASLRVELSVREEQFERSSASTLMFLIFWTSFFLSSWGDDKLRANLALENFCYMLSANQTIWFSYLLWQIKTRLDLRVFFL